MIAKVNTHSEYASLWSKSFQEKNIFLMDEVRDCLYFYINLPRKQHQSNDRKGQQPVRIRFLVIQIFQEKNIFLMDEVRDCLYLGKTLRKQTY